MTDEAKRAARELVHAAVMLRASRCESAGVLRDDVVAVDAEAFERLRKALDDFEEHEHEFAPPAPEFYDDEPLPF